MKRTGTKAIVIHTTASNTNTLASQVMYYFKNVLGWSKGGYHYIYERSGKEIMCYDPEEMEATNGILPGIGLNNFTTIHLSYIGGINNQNQNEAVCNITPEQETALVERVRMLLNRYTWAKVVGHNQINLKGCPSFWVPDWALKHNIDKKNIVFDDAFNVKDIVKAFPHPQNFYENKNKVCPMCGK
jgi:hypothetical protein